jgi:anti-anti-sigma factor
MATEVTRTAGVLIMIPDGRIDDKEAPRLQKLVESHLGTELRFLIDLSQTELISGAGLRVLLMLTRRLKAAGGALEICAPRPHVAESFEVAGLSSSFSISESRSQAMRVLLSSSVLGTVAELAQQLLDGGRTGHPRPDPRQAPEEVITLAHAVGSVLAVGLAQPTRES